MIGNLRIGLSSGALYPETPTEAVAEIAAGWGATDVELMLQTPGEHEPGFVRDAVEVVRSTGGEVRSLHSFQQLFHFFTPYARRTEESFSMFGRLIDTAGELGVPVIVWHGPTREEAPAPDQWGDFLRVTSRLAALAHEAGVTLALENVSWCALASVRDCFAFANRLGDLGPPGSLGFNFDPWQAAKAGANPFMILNAMADHLINVHLADLREDAMPNPARVLPGQGDLPWSALLRAIAGTGYAGPMMLESPLDPAGEGWSATRAYLDPLIAALSVPVSRAPLPPGVIEGIEFFNAGQWYEAHETLEHEWHAERGEDRKLYQGILQIGVGLHHARSGNHRGAVLLLTDGIEKTARFTPTHRGLDTARLIREAQTCLDQVLTLGPDGLNRFDWSLVPIIGLPEPVG
jgi:sugar phosphate isomerase/epimerase/predicted metal-dependent hydrolase